MPRTAAPGCGWLSRLRARLRGAGARKTASATAPQSTAAGASAAEGLEAPARRRPAAAAETPAPGAGAVLQAAPDAVPPQLHPRLAPWAHKVCTAQQAVAHIRPGSHVFVGTACATPRSLVAALEAMALRPADVELVHFLTDHAVPHNASGEALTHYRHRSFFVGADMRAAVHQGLADYVPLSLARVPEMMTLGRIAVDVALIQVSLPDAQGRVSLGVSVDVIPAAVARARLVLAEVNPQMPRSCGDSELPMDLIDHLVVVDTPVIEYQHAPVSEAAMVQIARYVRSIIEDGSTVQIGLGRIANEALKHLSGRQDLGIHSDVITDAIIPLLERGILTGRRKTDRPGTIVASFAMGSRRLYDLIDGNPLFCFEPIDVVCNPATLAAQHKMVSVTQALAVDLSGQVCADQYQGRFYSGLAAQAEFLQGASRSPGGKPIICLASTDDEGRSSRIRVTLLTGEGVTVARSDVHYVITEFGIAYLFGKSMRERAVALIGIAHPRFRAELLAQAQQLGLVPPEQALKNMLAYPVEEEYTVVLGNGRSVLLRPAFANDGEGIRDLFHSLSDRDRYTRFFRRVRGLSNRDVQRLCNLNFENEVAFVAVSGERENPVIVGHACYFTEAATGLAETAFMVHPDWQGGGLGGELQRCLGAHARGHGVRGFVAEILADNERMIRLARAGAADGPDAAEVEHSGSTVRVTTRF